MKNNISQNDVSSLYCFSVHVTFVVTLFRAQSYKDVTVPSDAPD